MNIYTVEENEKAGWSDLTLDAIPTTFSWYKVNLLFDLSKIKRSIFSLKIKVCKDHFVGFALLIRYIFEHMYYVITSRGPTRCVGIYDYFKMWSNI